MQSKDTLAQLNVLTTTLVALSLSNEQNFPTTNGDPATDFEITIKNATQLTKALKNVPYHEIYAELHEARCFNFKMLDGALITLRYRFRNGNVCEHSLTFFPSPNLEHFQNEPDLYLNDEIYADVVARNLVPFPIRFDFNSDAGRFVEIHHPYSHLTLGQYENCRIPVCSPLGPFTFGTFILQNFYNTAFRKYSEDIPSGPKLFGNTITSNELAVSHFVLGVPRSNRIADRVVKVIDNLFSR